MNATFTDTFREIYDQHLYLIISFAMANADEDHSDLDNNLERGVIICENDFVNNQVVHGNIDN